MAAHAEGNTLIRFTPPALATLVDAVPTGDGWMHEVKYDGYRLQAVIDRGRCRLLTRSGLDWTAKFAGLAQACEGLPVDRAILDGEAVVRTAAGITSFQRLQQELEAGNSLEVGYVVFDLAQRVLVMHHGELLADGTPKEIRADPEVRTAYLGEGAPT